MYTEFRKRVEGQGVVRQLISMPDTIPPLPEGIDQGDIPDITEFGAQGENVKICINTV